MTLVRQARHERDRLGASDGAEVGLDGGEPRPSKHGASAASLRPFASPLLFPVFGHMPILAPLPRPQEREGEGKTHQPFAHGTVENFGVAGLARLQEQRPLLEGP